MRKTLILIINLIFFFNGFSQETPTSFSLQEAIEYALQNNRAAVNASRDIDAAKQQEWETTAVGLPQINGSIAYQDFIKQQVQIIPSDFGDPNSELVPVIFGLKKNVNASATVSQILFDGSYIVGVQASKVFLAISENAKVKTDLQVRQNVINAYGNVLLTEESVKIFKGNVDVLKKNLDDTVKIYENGLEEEESVEQLKITLSDVENNLRNLERLKDLAYKMLNITLSLNIDNPTLLTDDLEALTFQNIQMSLLASDEIAENNIDFKIAENDKNAKALSVKLEQSKFLPTLNAFLSGGYLSFSDNFDFLQSNQDYFGFAVFGVNLDIPIFSSGLRSASTQRAKIELEKAETELTETEQRIRFEISSAKSDYRFAIENYENKRENLTLAERIESKNQTKFFEGIGSSFELRQAQTQLYSAQQELLQAMLDVITTKAILETALNTVQLN